VYGVMRYIPVLMNGLGRADWKATSRFWRRLDRYQRETYDGMFKSGCSTSIWVVPQKLVYTAFVPIQGQKLFFI